MGKIYQYQESLRIRLTTDVDITDAITIQIRYEKPDKTTGSWNAEIEDEIKGIIYYDVELTEHTSDGLQVIRADIDQAGVWKFWAFITFSDGRSAPGKVARKRIYTEGT